MAAHGKRPSHTRPEPVITYWSAPTGIGQSAWKALEAHPLGRHYDMLLANVFESRISDEVTVCA
jgi:hypothetical protein